MQSCGLLQVPVQMGLHLSHFREQLGQDLFLVITVQLGDVRQLSLGFLIHRSLDIGHRAFVLSRLKGLIVSEEAHSRHMAHRGSDRQKGSEQEQRHLGNWPSSVPNSP